MAVKSNYKLDARIESMDDVQTCLHYDDSYIGEKGYFASDLCDLSDLSKCLYGTLAQIILDGAGDDIFRTPHDVDYDNWGSRFFVPERLLKSVEKKYRAYTLKEFIDDVNLGEPWIKMRPVGTNKECKFLYTGYSETVAGEYICLGCFQFDFISLFTDYEICVNGEWQPFGIKVEE